MIPLHLKWIQKSQQHIIFTSSSRTETGESVSSVFKVEKFVVSDVSLMIPSASPLLTRISSVTWGSILYISDQNGIVSESKEKGKRNLYKKKQETEIESEKDRESYDDLKERSNAFQSKTRDQQESARQGEKYWHGERGKWKSHGNLQNRENNSRDTYSAKRQKLSEQENAEK